MPESGDIEQPVLAFDVDSDLIHTWSDCCHRFPIARLHAVLEQLQLIADLLPNRFAQRANSLETIAHPFDWFQGFSSPHQYTRLCISGR